MGAPIELEATRTPGHPWPSVSAAQQLAGVSFKHVHLHDILADALVEGFFEVHAENYMGMGGPPHRMLTAIRQDYPLSLHGVCMSIGGPDELDTGHLAHFRDLVRRYEPSLVSEHLAWSSHGGTFFNDLLPLPYNQDTLARVCSHIDQVQDAIERPLLLENPATYVAFASSTMSEIDFIKMMVQRTGCGVLLDINNVFVSAANHGFSASAYLAEFPLEQVGEIHLAGHSAQVDDEGDALLIDGHDRAVADVVWDLYDSVIARGGSKPTLIEWDSDLPDWPILRDQAFRARQIMAAHRASQPRAHHVA
ncbi:UPF0276 protein Bphyt_5128 [Bordetella tumbae]|uniref:MNIO family bufferin maturase n=1 Tax=Bordetella tumbae TaxID=1649139 RepID=UPI0039EE2F75